MNRISRCDWLPELARCGAILPARDTDFVLSCFGVLSHIINPWRVYHKHAKKELGQYPAILTERAWSITHIYQLLVLKIRKSEVGVPVH